MIEVSQDIRRTAIEALRHIPGASRRALVNGLNRAATAARTEAYSAVTAEYPRLTGAFLDSVTIHPATKERLIATVKSTGQATKLDEFPHRPSAPGTGGKGKPVLRATIKLRRAYTPVPGAFIIPTSSGKNIAVWRSKTGSLRRVPALAVPFMMTDETVYSQIERRAGDVLEERVMHEIAHELGKGGK